MTLRSREIFTESEFAWTKFIYIQQKKVDFERKNLYKHWIPLQHERVKLSLWTPNRLMPSDFGKKECGTLSLKFFSIFILPETIKLY